MISLKHFVLSTFTHLSTRKRWLVRGAVLLVGAGGIAKGVQMMGGDSFSEDGWSWSSIQSGLGFILAFILGAALRLFFKLSLVVGFIGAGIAFGLSKLGWVDLPFEEFGELFGAFTDAAKEQLSSATEFVTGFLPATAASTVGLASGVTQKPDWTPDDDD